MPNASAQRPSSAEYNAPIKKYCIPFQGRVYLAEYGDEVWQSRPDVAHAHIQQMSHYLNCCLHGDVKKLHCQAYPCHLIHQL